MIAWALLFFFSVWEVDGGGLPSPSSSPTPTLFTGANLIAPLGYFFPPGSTSAANATICPVASFCPGGSPGVVIPCFPATACPIPGLSVQPTCYWNTSTLAGNGAAGYSNGVGTLASFRFPERIVLDGNGDFVFVDSDNSRIRKVTPSGLVSTLAGNANPSFLDSTGTNAGFNRPFGIDMDASGNFIIADQENNRIRLLSPSGVVTTIAGSGSSSFADNIGTAASFNRPSGIAIGSTGVIFVSDFENARIRSVTPTGLVTTFAGSGVAGWTDGLGVSAQMNSPNGITADKNNFLYWPDYKAHRIRKASPIGLVSTIAGSGIAGSVNGIGTAASFNFPRTVAIWGSNVLVADGDNNLIRLINPAGVVTSLLGSGGASSINGWGTTSTFNGPHGIAVDNFGSIIIGEETGQYLRMASCVPCPASYSCSSGVPLLCPFSSAHCTGQLWGTGLSTSNGLDNQWTYSLGGDNITLSASAFSPAPTDFIAPGWDSFPGETARWTGVPLAAVGWYTFSTPFFSSVGFTLNGTYSVDNAPGRVILTPSGDFTALDQSVVFYTLGSFSITTTNPCSSLSFTVQNQGDVPSHMGLFVSFKSLSLKCPAGSFSRVVSTLPLQTVCAPCPAGVYGSTSGLTSSACSGNCTAAPGFGCPAGSVSLSNVTQCVPGFFCPGGTPALYTPCSPSTACTIHGLSAQPPCYWNVSTFVGSGLAGLTDGQGTAASMENPTGIAYYAVTDQFTFIDYSNHQARRISSTGNVSYMAGSRLIAYADGQGTIASFNFPHGITLDQVGNSYIADSGNNRIRRMSPTGLVTTFIGDGGVGTNALLIRPTHISFDATFSTGFITEQNPGRIRSVVMASLLLSTVAGFGSSGFKDGVGTQAMFSSPSSTIWHSSGVLFVADQVNNRIRLVMLSNNDVITFAGSSSPGFTNGVGTSASFTEPRGITLDTSFSVLYVTEWTGGNRIRSVTIATRVVNTIAGSGIAGFADGFGLSALFSASLSLAVTPVGVLYVSDFYNNRIRKLACIPCPTSFFCASGTPVICPQGSYCPLSTTLPLVCPAGRYSASRGASDISTCLICNPGSFSIPGSAFCSLCPSGVYGSNSGLTSPACSGNCTASSGYGCPAGSTSPTNVTLCPAFSFCPGGTPAPIIPCSPSTACTEPGLPAQPPCYWNVSTLAGNGTAGWADGQGTAAILSATIALSINPLTLDIYVGDQGSQRVRKISHTGFVTTIAGSGSAGFADGIGVAASFFGPSRPQYFNSFLYLADYANNRLRQIDTLNGKVITLVGSGTYGSLDGVGTMAQLSNPSDIVFDSSGANAYIVEQSGNKIRVLKLASLMVSTLVGSSAGISGFADGIGTQALFNYPSTVVWHPSGVLYVGELFNPRIRLINLTTNTVTTCAGSSSVGGSDGIGTNARFNNSRSVILDPTFSILYVAEQISGRIRSIDLSTSIVKTIAGGNGPPLTTDGFGSFASFNSPAFLISAPFGELYVPEVYQYTMPSFIAHLACQFYAHVVATVLFLPHYLLFAQQEDTVLLLGLQISPLV